MKVLFASGRQLYPFFRGGDGVTMHEMAEYLANKGYQVHSLGVINPERRFAEPEVVDKWLRDQAEIRGGGFGMHKIEMVFNDELLSRFSLLANYYDIIIIQMERSDELIGKLGNNLKKACLYVHDCSPENLPCINSLHHIWYNSEFTQNYFGRLGCKAGIVVYPFFGCKYGDYIASMGNAFDTRQTKDKFSICMVNPIAIKGLHILEYLAAHFQDIEFRVVSGWNSHSLCGSDSSVNIMRISRTFNIEVLLHECNLLLFPSQYNEPFGRVIVEAGFVGVPSLASSVGGISEAIGDGGILVRDYTEPVAWKSALTKVTSSSLLYRDLQYGALRNANRFHPGLKGPELEDQLMEIQSRAHSI